MPIEEGRTITAYVSKAEHLALEALGEGNVSAGVRLALQRATILGDANAQQAKTIAQLIARLDSSGTRRLLADALEELERVATLTDRPENVNRCNFCNATWRFMERRLHHGDCIITRLEVALKQEADYEPS